MCYLGCASNTKSLSKNCEYKNTQVFDLIAVSFVAEFKVI